MCITRTFIVAACAAFIGFKSNAESMETQLNSHNVSQQRLSFTIKSSKFGSNMVYRILVESKSESVSSNLWSSLEVFDGTNMIVNCAVEPMRHDKSAVYEFEISQRYLVKSRFTFGNMAEEHDLPNGRRWFPPYGDLYWFYLKDFADKK